MSVRYTPLDSSGNPTQNPAPITPNPTDQEYKDALDGGSDSEMYSPKQAELDAINSKIENLASNLQNVAMNQGGYYAPIVYEEETPARGPNFTILAILGAGIYFFLRRK